MHPFMHLQNSSFNKRLVAHGTGKWLLSSVSLFMYLQIATLGKIFFTFGTGKWCLSCEGPFMLIQMSTLFLQVLSHLDESQLVILLVKEKSHPTL